MTKGYVFPALFLITCAVFVWLIFNPVSYHDAPGASLPTVHKFSASLLCDVERGSAVLIVDTVPEWTHVDVKWELCEAASRVETR